MQKFRFSDKKTRNLIVSMTLSFVVAMPMLAQPLGLYLQYPRPIRQPLQAKCR